MIKILRFLSKREIQQRQLALGINSFISVEDNLHIIMIDYDILNITNVLESVNELTDFWNLGPYEVYSTKNGFHVFFWWTFVPFSRLKMILDYCRYIDESYRYISRYYNYKTVRASGKYITPDINFVGKFNGKITPSKDERELGDLKRKEYIELKKIVFNKEHLK